MQLELAAHEKKLLETRSQLGRRHRLQQWQAAKQGATGQQAGLQQSAGANQSTAAKGLRVPDKENAGQGERVLLR